jgi:hypothetical protein
MKITASLPIILATASVAIATSSFSPASAASLNFSINEFTGDNAKVDFLLEDLATDTVRFTVSVDQTVNKGDIVGVFFNVNNIFSVSPGAFTASLIDVDPDAGTANKLPSIFSFDNSGSTTDNNKDLGNNVNLNGGGDSKTLDFGVQIGKGGASDQGAADFFSKVVFDIKATGLTLAQFQDQSFGARLQSVGPNGGGSSKLFGDATTPTPTPTPQPESVPEPGSVLGLALIGGALKVLRDRSQR